MSFWLSCDRFSRFLHDPGGSRTRDLRIKSPLLYQLSYRVVALQTANSEQRNNTTKIERAESIGTARGRTTLRRSKRNQPLINNL